MFLKFIQTNQSLVITRFGRYHRLKGPGMRWFIPFIEQSFRISNKLYEHNCSMTIRTADKVFPKLDIAIQYRIKHQDSVKSLFELENPLQQMNSYTDNIVRKTCSKMNLDQLFQSQTNLADDILQQVGPKMKEGGFTLQSVQIRNISPPEEILKSMNQINAAQRRRTAAQFDGEASKIKAVLMAEADAKEKQLRGKGIAAMRSNITEGWVHSVKEMADKSGIPAHQVVKFLTNILQQETMESMSKYAGTKVIFMDKSMSTPTSSIIEGLEAHQFKNTEEKL